MCVRQPACSLPGGPRPKGRQKISSPSYRETYFPVILDVWQLACSIPGGSQLPNGQDFFTKLYRERFSIVLDVRPLACSRPGGQGRQMARTPFPTVVEGRISWPCQVSGSSPAASQEVQAARWPESVPQNYKCKDSLVILGVQQLSCSLPGDSKPPNGRDFFSHVLVRKISGSFGMAGSLPAAFHQGQCRQKTMKSCSKL